MYSRDRLAHWLPDTIKQLLYQKPTDTYQLTRCMAAITSREAVESSPDVGSSASTHMG